MLLYLIGFFSTYFSLIDSSKCILRTYYVPHAEPDSVNAGITYLANCFKFLCLVLNIVPCNLGQEMDFPCLSRRMANLLWHLNRWRSSGFSTRWGMNSNPTNGIEFAMWPINNKTKHFIFTWCFNFPITLMTTFTSYFHSNLLSEVKPPLWTLLQVMSRILMAQS